MPRKSPSAIRLRLKMQTAPEISGAVRENQIDTPSRSSLLSRQRSRKSSYFKEGRTPSCDHLSLSDIFPKEGGPGGKATAA